MLELINRYFIGGTVPVMLILMGIYFGFKLRWFHLLHPILTVKHSVSGGIGVRNAFSSLCLALAGTLGVGNIVGVSAAIILGGYGAVFWMWVSAFFAMILKYSEIVLAMRHRRKNLCGEWIGAAAFYIEDCLKGRLGRGVGIVFSSCLILNAMSMGSAIQTKAIADSFEAVLNIPSIVTSGVVAVGVLLVVVFGRRGIMKLTDALVPFMTLGFLCISVAAVVLRWKSVPSALCSIVSEAFSTDAAIGGVLGFFTSRALRFGTMRGLISNEAGCGTSPMAHSVSEGSTPSAQGIWGIFEVFTDTVVLCTVTALVIIISGVPLQGGEYMMTTIRAYSEILGTWSEGFMTVAVLLFGFATVICWYHYGVVGVEYLSTKKWIVRSYLIVYILSVAFSNLLARELSWQIADLSIGIMTLINLAVLFVMRREIIEEGTIISGRY